MAKILLYTNLSTPGIGETVLTGTDTVIDNNFASAVATRMLLDGTPVKSFTRLSSAAQDGTGRWFGTINAGDQVTYSSITRQTNLGPVTTFVDPSGLGAGMITQLVGSPAVGSNTSVSAAVALLAASATSVHAAVTLSASSQTITGGFTQPANSQIVSVTGNASGIVGNVLVNGVDYLGVVQQDVIALSGTSTVAGVIYFDSISSVAMPVQTHVGTDTVSVGTTGVQRVNTGITNPDVTRNLVVKGSAALEAGNVVLNGTSYNGSVITETDALNGTAAVVGTRAFKTVTDFILPVLTTAGDTVSIGTGAKLGLSFQIGRNTVLKAFLNGVVEGTAPTVASGSSVELSTATLNSTLNSTPVNIDYYIP